MASKKKQTRSQDFTRKENAMENKTAAAVLAGHIIGDFPTMQAVPDINDADFQKRLGIALATFQECLAWMDQKYPPKGGVNVNVPLPGGGAVTGSATPKP